MKLQYGGPQETSGELPLLTSRMGSFSVCLSLKARSSGGGLEPWTVLTVSLLGKILLSVTTISGDGNSKHLAEVLILLY